ncbi:MAG: winged helix-turn-helix domain-containing protein [Candidatus Thorarchaeota archaeon]
MTKPVVHVAIFDKDAESFIDRVAIQRRLDEIILVCATSYDGNRNQIIDRYSNLGFKTTFVDIDSNSFNDILSTLLNVVNHSRLDNYIIEFNVICNNPIMTVAASVAAIMIGAILITTDTTNISASITLRPNQLLHMSPNKRKIMEYLDEKSCPVLQAEISSETLVTRSCVSRHLKDLIHAGYVKRNRAGRNKVIWITSLGQVVVRHKLLRKRREWGNDVISKTCFAAVGQI